MKAAKFKSLTVSSAINVLMQSPQLVPTSTLSNFTLEGAKGEAPLQTVALYNAAKR